jgi:hypothetical protein
MVPHDPGTGQAAHQGYCRKSRPMGRYERSGRRDGDADVTVDTRSARRLVRWVDFAQERKA